MLRATLHVPPLYGRGGMALARRSGLASLRARSGPGSRRWISARSDLTPPEPKPEAPPNPRIEITKGPKESLKNKHSHSAAAWPDPLSLPHSSPHVDDVSRLNPTEVERVLQPRTVADLRAILTTAKNENRKVSVRGTQHSMGGQSIAPEGFVLDMRHFNELRFDPKRNAVIAGTGAQWADLIRYLNQFGLSPRTMQSYSSFSVGGTLAVNAHGITTDFCLAESVLEFKIILADGSEVLCSRESKIEDARELFSLALGGYGLFGIITVATFKVNPNVHLQLDLLRLSPKEFPRVFDRLLESDPESNPKGDVDIKMARLDITTLDSIELYTFRRVSDVKTVSSLSLKPRELSTASRLIYKWLAPTMQELRFTVERAMGNAFDWSGSNERNSLMYESAVPLAKLYSPLLNIDDTFILQEFFVPKHRFQRWLELVKPIYQRIKSHTLLSLLNTTIRFVKHDKDTHLAYSREPEGSYAFVLYYRMRRTADADKALKGFHEEFAKVALELGGSFYLPYRHHYSHAELERAYGKEKLISFFKEKEEFDPECRFSSVWFEAYGPPYLSEAYKSLINTRPSSNPNSSNSNLKSDITPFAQPLANYIPRVVSEHRTDSYRTLMANSQLRRAFMEEFLVKVFNIEDPNALYRIISKAVWDPSHATDIDVYAFIQAELAKEGGVVKALGKTWAQLKQLRDQKEELTRETVSIVSRLGKMGQIHDYVSIGDNGKMVFPFRSALDMRGQVWVVHDVPASSLDLAVVLERGSVDPIGTFLPVDYGEVDTPSWPIPDNSADLVTMNQGLHHLPQAHLMRFLAQVKRILRPGGIFIVREHNAKRYSSSGGEVPTNVGNLIPLLDLAHSVFNAVTGVTLNDERTEIRAFRSVQEWREIVSASGLVDTMLSEVQSDDPTIDEMLCFYKPPFLRIPIPRTDLPSESLAAPESPALPALSNLLQSIPKTTFSLIKGVVEGFITNLPSISSTIVTSARSVVSPGVAGVLQQEVERGANEIKVWFERFRPFLDSTELGGDTGKNVIPPELFLIIPALNRKVAKGQATALEMLAVALIQDIQRALVSGSAKPVVQHTLPVSKHSTFTSAGLLSKFQELSVALPRLKTVAVLDDLGLPDLVKNGVKSYWAASESAKELDDALDKKESPPEAAPNPMARVAERALQFLDEVPSMLDSVSSWNELSKCLDEIIAAKASPPSVSSIIRASKGENVDGKTSEALWGRALRAALSSTRVFFNRSQLMQLRFVGFGELYDAYLVAQERRSASVDGDAGLIDALAPLTSGALKEVSMEESKFEDLYHVSEVVFASYGYSTLMTKPFDVKELLQKHVRDGTLHLSEISPAALERERRVLNPLFDFIRKAWSSGTSRLVVKYRPRLDADPRFMERTERLLETLAQRGIVKSLHHNDGHLTFFKLPEWLQVEMAQTFSQFMNHTPWYRFPFMDFIGLYFRVFAKEVAHVRTEHGLAKALLSQAFFIDLVPGIVMLLLFGQMQLLASPIKAVAGSEYASPELMVEQVTFLLPHSGQVNWKSMDPRVVNAVQPVQGQGLHVLTVPTFKPLTDFILALAKNHPEAQILEISNQKWIQVKVSLPQSASDTEEAKLIAEIAAVPGCSILLHYRYPVDGPTKNRAPVMVAVRASAFSLIRLTHFCWNRGITVQQFYDFFN